MTRVAPAKVRAEAKLGLELHKKWKRGGTNVGVARAVQLASGKVVSDNTIKRMRAYFLRHQHDRLDKDGSDGSIPGRGYIAWLLWGGWSGRKWAESEYKKLGGKKKNPISKPVKKIKEDLAKKTIYLIQVTLDDYRSEPWAQEMVTKEEDFEVVDNYTDSGEPIFKTCEYVLSVVPKKYLQDFEFLRQMQMEGKLEKHSFSSAARAWLENDQPLDWFNEQAQDRGYLTKDEYLFLRKVNNPTISDSVEERKKYFIELAKECQSRPKWDTKDGLQLTRFLRDDKNFKAKIKELCPQWFKGDTGPTQKTLEMMEYIRELAKSGAPRPPKDSKDPDERKLGANIVNLFTTYPKFREEIQELRPDWFYESVKDEVTARKNYFVELARECQSRPKKYTKDGQQLTRFLQTDKNFKAKIKELCPQWFRGDTGPTQKTLELMEYVRELAKSGAPKPSDRSKDPDERKLGKNISSLFARYPKFREEILALRPDWFMTEERTRFAEYKEENPFKMMNPARNVANVEDVKKGNPETPKEITDIKEYLKTVSSLKPFKALFKWQLKVCEPVNIISYKDDPEIKNMVDQFLKKKKVKMKGCYENSFNIANTFPEIECVFGYAMNEASIEHSWNCYKGKHFDLTSEIVLKDQPFKKNYLQIIKMDAKKALDYFQKINMIDSLIRPYYFTEVDKGMKKNPLSSTEEKTNEYLPIVQESLQTHEKSLEAWVDEKTNDILIGTMSFEEDRSFDDVLIRIKTTGQIKEGESVDDGIRPAVQNLMKKVHKDLVEYVTNKKGNPIPEKYLKGSTDREERKKELEKNLKAHQKGESKFSDKDWATDFDESGERIETVPSKYTEAFHKKYNPSSLDKAIKNKAKECGVPLTIARAVVKRGQAAWASGHRPGTTPEQWGLARLNSFCVGGKTTKTADRDLFDKWKKKVR